MVPVVDDSVVMIRQYRAPVGDFVLELPAGKLDKPGENPAPAATRELVEEVGYRPGRLERIATFWTGPGFTDERITVFLATECEPEAASPHGPEEENAEILHVAIADLPEMLAADAFEDAKTIVGLQAFLQRR
jgi:ADP-ribose pyrophosphatase